MGVLSSNRGYPYNIMGLTVDYLWLWWVAKLIFRMFSDVHTMSIFIHLGEFMHIQMTWQHNSLSAFTVYLVHNYGGNL